MTEHHEQTTPSVQSLDDIFSSDRLGLLDDIGNVDILGDNTHSIRAKKRILNTPDDTADRYPCPDFDNFRPIFFKIEQLIQQGKYKIQNSRPTDYVKKNAVFVLQGMLCFVADIYEDSGRQNSYFKDRIRLVFANGTESNMLARSLATALSKHRQTSHHVLMTDDEWLMQFPLPDDDLFRTHDDARTGVIYVARLTQPRAEFMRYLHLHKIGFTKGTGDERIKNCLDDETFLYSDVEIIAEYEMSNANAQKIEFILHSFFAEQKLNMRLLAKDGRYYKPSEWFNVPIEMIDRAIDLIGTGQINQYRYNDYLMSIEKR